MGLSIGFEVFWQFALPNKKVNKTHAEGQSFWTILVSKRSIAFEDFHQKCRSLSSKVPLGMADGKKNSLILSTIGRLEFYERAPRFSFENAQNVKFIEETKLKQFQKSRVEKIKNPKISFKPCFLEAFAFFCFLKPGTRSPHIELQTPNRR